MSILLDLLFMIRDAFMRGRPVQYTKTQDLTDALNACLDDDTPLSRRAKAEARAYTENVLRKAAGRRHDA